MMRHATWLFVALATTSACTLIGEAVLDGKDEGDATTGGGGAASASATTASGSSSVAGAGPGPGPGPASSGAGAAGGSEPCGGCEAGYWCDGTSCLCQAPPPAPAVDCPDPCTSCDLAVGLCIVALTGDHQGEDIQCPQGMACRFECGASKGCEQAKLHCPAVQACEVVCSEEQSCTKAVIIGAEGGVTVQCLGAASCQDTDLKCGEGPCIHPCPTGTDGPLKVTCGGSCSCQAC